jgi:16S rRNA (adenine1518-N6/adenine1519-N6)-dimethyltransferase
MAACLDMLERVTAAAFGQRRKMLRASLKSLFQDSETVLGELGINPELRAEQIEVSDFARIAVNLASRHATDRP